MKTLDFCSVLFAPFSVLAAAVTVLPEPDADGYYVFGSPYTYEGKTSYGFDADGPAYPVWRELNVPSGAKIRLTGGVILDSFPEGVTEVETAGLTFLAVTAEEIGALSGLSLTIPASAVLCPCRGTLSVGEGGAVSWTGNAECNNPLTLPCDLTLNGKLIWQKNALSLPGTLSGSGTIQMSAEMNARVYVWKTAGFTGEILGGNSSQQIWYQGAAPGSFGGLYVLGKNNDSNPSLGNAFFIATNDVALSRLDAGAALLLNGARYGSTFCFAHGLTAEIGMLTGVGAHFITADSATAAQSDAVGAATVEIDNVYPPGRSSGSKEATYYLSKNQTYRIGGVCSNLDHASDVSVTFSYDAETAGVNTNGFSIGAIPSGSQVSWVDCLLTGPSPALMPRRIALPPNASLASGCDVAITGTDWTFEVDAARPDPCPSACEITGEKTFSCPPSGTIAVTVPEDSGTAAVDGVYPLLTWTSDGPLLSAEDWPATFNGTAAEEATFGTVTYTLCRGTKGLSLAVKVARGFRLLVR